MQNCSLCPHACHADRQTDRLGYCRSDDGFNISSICLHKGEEPVISGERGICNVFFSRCNMQCIYCQNYQISRNTAHINEKKHTLHEVIDAVTEMLDEGCTHVGFVSPSHMISQMMAIMEGVKKKAYNPVFVYNSNGYDSLATLKSLEGLVDIYLPDFKYMDAAIARAYSGVEDYPSVAASAIKEMYRQKGSTLIMNEGGTAASGLIIRHLVLPGHVENSIAVLKFIAEEISTRVHISLMSQYYPTAAVQHHENLGRRLQAEEYSKVCDEMEKLGLHRGWMQELESHITYRPDFKFPHPFEHDF
jgi:putative pyruvate formate lyase activating enzyme